jgi:hypothetical protein
MLSSVMSASLKTIMSFGYGACKNQFMACLLYEFFLLVHIVCSLSKDKIAIANVSC